MRKIFKYCLLLFVVLSVKLNAQAVPIPDVNLKNFLQANYPTTILLGELNPVTAAAVLNFSCTGAAAASINDFSTLEYFIGLTSLTINNSPVTTLPSLNSMVALTNLNLANNQLTSIPSLNSNILLLSLDCSNNNLTTLPSLSLQVSMTSLKCSGNQLTALPDISTNLLLTTIDCSDNNLTTLPNLSLHVSLTNLNCEKNQLTLLPDLSTNLLLLSLDCSDNNLAVLSNLTMNASMTNLDCSNNQLTSLPDLSTNVLLLTLNASNNNLSSLPNFSLLVSLITSDFTDNKLTFEDFLPSTGNPVFNTNFLVHPQDSIPTVLQAEAVEGMSFSYSLLSIDAGVTSNVYTWYKDGNVISTGSSSELYIAEVNKSDVGTYVCSITNSNVPALTLTTQKIYLKVNECKDKCIKEITPDGDGINDTYYISDSGTAKIYDRNGVLIKQFSIPSSWDGTTSDHTLGTTGLYLIEINGEKQVKVYLFR
jgi:gliding motility-associated-like protein